MMWLAYFENSSRDVHATSTEHAYAYAYSVDLNASHLIVLIVFLLFALGKPSRFCNDMNLREEKKKYKGKEKWSRSILGSCLSGGPGHSKVLRGTDYRKYGNLNFICIRYQSMYFMLYL